MKKENKKLAQQRRAEERRKKARAALLKKIGIAAAVVVVLGGFIIYGVIDSKKNGGEEAGTQSTSGNEAAADENASTDKETTGENSDAAAKLNTDTSHVIAEGDLANIDYAGSIDGIAFSGGTGKYDLEIGSHSFIDDFEEQLIGHKVGEKVEVQVTFPSGYSGTYTDAQGEEKPLAGADAVFQVTINGVYE